MAAPTDAALVKKVLANSEPSTHGPFRHLVALHQIGRDRSGAEVDRTPNPAHQVEIGSQQTSTMRSSRLRLARVRLLSAWRTQFGNHAHAAAFAPKVALRNPHYAPRKVALRERTLDEPIRCPVLQGARRDCHRPRRAGCLRSGKSKAGLFGGNVAGRCKNRRVG